MFKARGLLQPIPDELVHPKPGNDDDEEARAFVDTNTLVKIGCFSGDWVKLETTPEPSQHPLFGLGAFGACSGPGSVRFAVTGVLWFFKISPLSC